MPAGNTGSLPPGCHACPPSAECSVLPGGAETQEDTANPTLDLPGVASARSAKVRQLLAGVLPGAC